MPSVSAELDTGEASGALPFARRPLTGFGVAEADGWMAGNSPAALLGPMSEPVPPASFRLGCGPSGSEMDELPTCEVPDEFCDDDDDDDADGEEDAAVTPTDSAAAGGVQVAVVATAAVAVSCTEPTELALPGTAICAWRVTGLLSAIEAIVQVAAPLPLAQPVVKVAFWLVGAAVRVTVTGLAAGPFWVAIVTV